MQSSLQKNPIGVLKGGRRCPLSPARHSGAVRCAAEWSPESRLPTLGLGLAAAAAAMQLIALPADAMWDGESSALGSCALGDAGDECRKRILTRDSLQTSSYAGMADNAAKVGGKATGIPVAELGSAYVKETTALGDSILRYAALDVYDPERVQLVKELKTQGQAWVSKYARGGSARTVSARRIYIAVDALQGHLASNGFAPYPKNKISKLVSDIEQGKALLAEGK